MAIAVGSAVRLQEASAGYLNPNTNNPQPTRFGVVTREDAPGGPFDVLFENGELVTSVADDRLDEVLAPTAQDLTTFLNKIVRYAGPTSPIPSLSPEFTARVVDVLQIDSGAGASRRLIVQAIGSGAFLELYPASQTIEVVGDR